MKPRNPQVWWDPLLWAGFLNSLILGIINPFYISLVLSRLDVRILSAGSFIASALPFTTGLLLEHQHLFEKAYKWLPIVMAIEIVISILAILISVYSVGAYYLVAMGIFGILSTSIVFLLQRLKERRYAGKRAPFERRYAMFDALGYLVGSALVFGGWIVIKAIWPVLVLGVIQVAAVYGLSLIPYWKDKERST